MSKNAKFCGICPGVRAGKNPEKSPFLGVPEAKNASRESLFPQKIETTTPVTGSGEKSLLSRHFFFNPRPDRIRPKISLPQKISKKFDISCTDPFFLHRQRRSGETRAQNVPKNTFLKRGSGSRRGSPGGPPGGMCQVPGPPGRSGGQNLQNFAFFGLFSVYRDMLCVKNVYSGVKLFDKTFKMCIHRLTRVSA